MFHAYGLLIGGLVALSSPADRPPPRVDRVVVLKVDGLPAHVLEQYLASANRRRVTSAVEETFVRQGVWFENFYVRGLSISAPSWSLLDTGRPLEIRGNVEYDRYTLRPYDYLNFFPAYVDMARSRRIDMPGVEVLDEIGVPLLIDRFQYGERLQGLQLLQRGVRLSTLGGALKRKLVRSPKDLFDEWQIGFSMSDSLFAASEQEMLDSLLKTEMRYLDLFVGAYDHVAHLTADPVTQMRAVDAVDAIVGRVWAAIKQSRWAETTALILVSDHGMTTDPGVYSQGYNLVDWFASSRGGAHHVLTNRHPQTEFKLKGLDPFVATVITPSARSSYLAGQGERYPTVMLDLDGNERAGIGLRNNALNKLHILLEQLTRKRQPDSLRAAVCDALFAMLSEMRPRFEQERRELADWLNVLDRRIEQLGDAIRAQPKRLPAGQPDDAFSDDQVRTANRLDTWKSERRDFASYLAALTKLLALDPAGFDPTQVQINDLIPARSLGPSNTVADLQNYVTGPAAGGLVEVDGRLDLTRSFQTVNYFGALSAISVRNNVQRAVGPRPIDFIATRISGELLRSTLPPVDWPDGDAVWLWRSDERQALLLRRSTGALRYVPIARLQAGLDGGLHFERREWDRGFPLEVWEDPDLDTPTLDRTEWLEQWHPERAWFEAVHRTRYSNGIIGLTETLLDPGDTNRRSVDDAFRRHKRQHRRVDLIAFASPGWNFNARGFNPGGNHGSFLRSSTRSVLLVAGGRQTGVPRSLRVTTPYDSLSFVPSILTLVGLPEADLPGPVIRELMLE